MHRIGNRGHTPDGDLDNKLHCEEEKVPGNTHHRLEQPTVGPGPRFLLFYLPVLRPVTRPPLRAKKASHLNPFLLEKNKSPWVSRGTRPRPTGPGSPAARRRALIMI